MADLSEKSKKCFVLFARNCMQREIPKKDEDKTYGGDVALTYPVAHADSISGRTD